MRKLDLGSLPDRITVTAIGDRVRVMLRAMTGEEIAADLSALQVDALRERIDEILNSTKAA